MKWFALGVALGLAGCGEQVVELPADAPIFDLSGDLADGGASDLGPPADLAPPPDGGPG